MKTRTLFMLGAMIVTMATFVIPVTSSYADCGSGWYMDTYGNCYQPDYNYNNSYSYNNTYDWNNRYNYNNQYQRSSLQSYVNQLNDLLSQLRDQQFGGYYNYNNSNYNYYYGHVSVTTNNPSQVGATQATMRGTVNFQNNSSATVFFQYGTGYNSLNTDTTHLVVNGNNVSTNFQAVVVQLIPNTTYYYRAVAIDQNGQAHYGSIYNFVTNTYNNYPYYNYNNTYPSNYWNNYSYNCGNNYYGCNYNSSSYYRPNVSTDNVTNVSNTGATINGTIDINNANSGYAFFVYGTSQNAIQNVAYNFNSYSQIMTRGNSLRKVGAGSTFATHGTYYYNLYNLPSGTRIYYAMCAETSDNNNQPQLTCGSTRSFYTNY